MAISNEVQDNDRGKPHYELGTARGTISIDVKGMPSPNGKAVVMLSCKCGRTISVELVMDEDANWSPEYWFVAPEGWLVNVRNISEYFRPRGGDQTVIRCPEHRSIV